MTQVTQLFTWAGAVAAVTAVAPPRTPGQALNLSGWQLQTCLASPRVVQGAELTTYTDSNFFLSDDGGGIVMLTPDNATAVTTHSTHPRTEFREVAVPDWPLDAGEHVLLLRTAVLRVSQPTTHSQPASQPAACNRLTGAPQNPVCARIGEQYHARDRHHAGEHRHT
jgi:hypothetical protein